eukprot:TRINITY_DN3057_c0_g1_i5.p1 TRINITY_DN3057_c0_g1~~TRINITY_DN3057_c0_g1_i5.p1  ORF type:complete len:105 (+),score=1.97 TRINITY_DN3057_c0_g1_i5:40-315(+)
MSNSSLSGGVQGLPPVISGLLFRPINSGQSKFAVKGINVAVRLIKDQAGVAWDSLFRSTTTATSRRRPWEAPQGIARSTPASKDSGRSKRG